mgnify:FL=1
MRFANRWQAGKELLGLVAKYSDDIDLVLAIPRGGVEVAAALAQELKKPVSLLSARKVGAPFNRELAIGAVAPDGSSWYNEELIRHFRLSPQELQALSLQAVAEQEKRRQAYGNEVDLQAVQGKGVLLIDDGAATGATLFAGLIALRRAGAAPVGVAVPVASREVVPLLQAQTDYFLALETPADFFAVGQYFREFRPVSDERVRQLLG